MAKNEIKVKDSTIRVIIKNDIEYISITDIAKQKNPIEPKDVIKNWFRTKNTIEYLGLWELLNNANFKGVEIDPLLKEAGKTMRTLLAQLPWHNFQRILKICNEELEYIILHEVESRKLLK